MVSIGTQLDRNRGLGPGFDFLRVALATMVVFSHTFLVCGGSPESMRSMWFVEYWVLAVFFSLSGFLITGSALRLKLSDFLKNRTLRIVPALAVDILISALILGPLVTSATLPQYFTSTEFFKYFLNIMGWPHYSLVGVFETHPFKQVNVSLWTVPWEISCYAIMAFFIKLGILRRTNIIIMLIASMMCLGLIIVGLDNGFPLHYDVNSLFHYFVAQRGARLIICFMLGILFFQRRFDIPYSITLFILCLFWCVILAVFIQPLSILSTYPVMNVLAAIPLVYIMAFIGVSRIPPLPLFNRGDYSYGIYLYGFPIQQVVYRFFRDGASPLLQFLVAMPLIVLVAICSWHLVEKPVVRLRRRFSFVARLRLEEGPHAENTNSDYRPVR